ncbi:MAG: hypothetical protein BGN97_10120 [Microbacterium sp. 69-10]|nr:MAG: hypothetical protein BGN97_10120 [Microbacterium sp. 69-10]
MKDPLYKRTTDQQPPAHREPDVPVVLPHVIMTIDGDGTMTVTVDGQAYEPEPYAPPWRRESFARLIDQLTNLRQCPIRVEVREADGSVFTDIITPGRRRQPVPEPHAQPAPPTLIRTQAPAGPPVLVGLQSEGFVPGEDVAVAVIVAHTDATPTGAVRAMLTAEQVAQAPTGEVVLLGRVSGTVAVGRPV